MYVDKNCHDCMMPVSTIATSISLKVEIQKFYLLFEKRMIFFNTVYHEQACCISALAAFIAEIKRFIYINFYINVTNEKRITRLNFLNLFCVYV